jgi:hypothetical protein
MTPQRAHTSLGDAGHAGAAAIRAAGRAAAQRALRRAGARVASLEQKPGPRWVVLRAIPRATARRFDGAAAGELDASFELRIRDPAGADPDRFAVIIAGGRCEVRTGPAIGAGAAVTIGADDMIRLASGGVGWPELLSSKRLELSGDPFLALRFPTLFRLPASAT